MTPRIPAARRFSTLMHDPQYREAITWQHVVYETPWFLYS
jgi:hypothetical protein